MAERPHNIRAIAILERSYANGGNHAGRAVPEENQHAYQGSHRASGSHHDDDRTPAEQRSSRVGRHHAEHSEDLSGRW